MPWKSHILDGFVRSAAKFATRPALEIEDRVWTYGQLAQEVGRLAVTLSRNHKALNSRVAILAYRSFTAYSGILGALAAAQGYVPLNPQFPIDRNGRMLTLSEAGVLVVGRECLELLDELLADLKRPLLIVCPDTARDRSLQDRHPTHQFIFAEDLIPAEDGPLETPKVDQDEMAYLLFTSGSTGTPKGVPISHRNAVSYLNFMARRYDFHYRDRFSQTFDITFDLSVHDMFLCFAHGACLCTVPKKAVMAPYKFIREKKLTVWFSVPSVGMFMSRMRMLQPNAFPELRYSLFCGEPFPVEIARKWQAAAPQSKVDNLYGPTEATIAIMYYRWQDSEPIDGYTNGIVPIGQIFEGQKQCIIDENRDRVVAGQKGELCLGGNQLSVGYLNNPEKTRAQFIKLPTVDQSIWYRTGDLAKEDRDGCLHYCGRIDHQVKILGHRVELQEIDHVLVRAAETQMALSVAWPVQEGIAAGVVGFLSGCDPNREAQILKDCKKTLPDYMVPTRLHFIPEMPLNANGKMDRKQLIQMLATGTINV